MKATEPQQQNMGRWMPESRETHYVFLREFFWSPAYRDACSPASGACARGRAV